MSIGKMKKNKKKFKNPKKLNGGFIFNENSYDLINWFSPKFPNYIKIDVDGIEDKIIEGAEKTLRDSRLKSVLIELDTRDTEYCQRVTSAMDRAGIKLVKKVTPNISRQSDFYPICNHILSRI